MTTVKTWVVDNIVGSLESAVLPDRQNFKIKAARACETISSDVLPQESIVQIFLRFPEMFEANSVRSKLFKRLRQYCVSDDLAQEVFDYISQVAPGAISKVGEILARVNALLFFRNTQLYNIFDSNLGHMYESLTYEQKMEFAPKVLATHGYLLRAINPPDRNKNLCLLAVTNSGTALRYVPVKLKTKNLMELAVLESGYALQYVTKKYQRLMICIALCRAGLNIMKHTWFLTLFMLMSEKERNNCIKMEKQERDDRANEWHAQNY